MIITSIKHINELVKIDNILVVPFKEQNIIRVISIFDLDTTKQYLIPINHYDNLINISIKSLFTHITGIIYGINSDLKSFINTDLNLTLSNYLQTTEKIEIDTTIDNISPVSLIHIKAETIFKKYLPTYKSFIHTKDFKFYNNISNDLYIIEQAGLHIDSEIYNSNYNTKLTTKYLYTRYNLYTTTGRPSNANNGINFAALKKKSYEREMIISRFKSGILLELDYSAYHLSILAKLINYDVEPNVNLHEYLGKQYFDTDKLTDEQYKKSKIANFQILYGSIPLELIEIDFFTQVEIYTNKIWNKYKLDGFILSPITGRKIQNIQRVNKYKLLNYLLQLLETEYNFITIHYINKFLKKYKSKLMLYTYDSFLFDINPTENITTELYDIVISSGFGATMKFGKNYKEI